MNRSLVESPAAMRRKMAELRKAHVGRGGRPLRSREIALR
jgi:hypothetical protein